jgi:hypothetical protein
MAGMATHISVQRPAITIAGVRVLELLGGDGRIHGGLGVRLVGDEQRRRPARQRLGSMTCDRASLGLSFAQGDGVDAKWQGR